MKLIKLPSKKTEPQPSAIRTLSADECRAVSGGGYFAQKRQPRALGLAVSKKRADAIYDLAFIIDTSG